MWCTFLLTLSGHFHDLASRTFMHRFAWFSVLHFYLVLTSEFSNEIQPSFFFLPSRRLSMWCFHTFHCAMLPPSSVGSAVFVLFCIIFTTSIIRQSCFATQTVGMPLTSQARRTIHFHNFYTRLLLIGFCAELSRLLYSPCAPLIVRLVWIAATTWLLTCIIQVCLVYLCPLNPRSFLAKPPP